MIRTLPVKERVLLIGILNPETGEYDDLDLEKRIISLQMIS